MRSGSQDHLLGVAAGNAGIELPQIVILLLTEGNAAHGEIACESQGIAVDRAFKSVKSVIGLDTGGRGQVLYMEAGRESYLHVIGSVIRVIEINRILPLPVGEGLAVRS